MVEVRDSRTGYFIPVRYGLGLLPDGRVVGAPSPSSPSASPGNHLEKVTLTVLVFGPESISYERSRRETAAKFHHFSARVFFVKISKSQDSRIYTILSFFRIHIPKMDSFPMLFSHPTRPPVRPSARHGSQVIKLVRVPVFLSSQVIKLVPVPVFLSSQVIKLVGVPVFLSSQVINMDCFPILS